MFRSIAAVSILFLSLLIPVHPQKQTEDANRVQLRLDASESEAVLAILDKRAAAAAITGADWQTLFATEPYLRLKKREASMHRDFTDDDFKKFVQSADLLAKRASLRSTLDAWTHADVSVAASLALAYLPPAAVIKAKVFPVIKPKTNSFVFDNQTDPAIFLYLDPEESAAQFANTVAHELHHIGYSSVESLAEERKTDLPANVKPAVEWMGAFGEGFAMLAAAGGPDADPQATSSAKDQERWKRDMANFNQDLESLQEFFLDVMNGNLATKEKIDQKGFTFFGVQGPWYTVGYKMAVIVEKRYGRKVLIDCMLDPRELLARYNVAADEINHRDPGHHESGQKLALWSADLMQRLRYRLMDNQHN